MTRSSPPGVPARRACRRAGPGSQRALGCRRGQAMVVFALGAVVLCALVGLVVDGGRAYVNRRALQGAGDAAAEADIASRNAA